MAEWLKDWDNIWGIVAVIIIIVVAFSVGVYALCSDHRIRFYYLQSGNSITCVVGNRNWADDKISYCSDDIDKVLKVLQAANNELRVR